jgi:hypothetical protein
MKVGSKAHHIIQPRSSTDDRFRAKVEARTRAVTAQDRKGFSGEAEEGEEASEEGITTMRDYGARILTSIGPDMALKDQEGTRHSQPVPLQR